MHKDMIKALNEQIGAEFYSAYLYLGMASYFSSIGLKGFAEWMEVQAAEELSHGMKIYNFILDCHAGVTLAPIEASPVKWETPLHAIEAAFGHEQEITKRIYNLVDLAAKHREHAVISFLQWFIDEQVEEEANASEILEKLKLAKDNSATMFLLNTELGQRKRETT